MGSYHYWFFYNYDPGQGPSADIPSTCSITMDDTTTSTHASGTVTCSAFVAMNISADYVSPPTTYEPSISLSATFDCDL